MFKKIILYFLSALVLCFSPNIYAKQRKQDTTEYHSRFDDSLTFKNVTYLPSIDNLNSIYAKHVDVKIEELIKKNHKWNFVQSHIAGSVIRPEEIVSNPKKVKEFSQHLKADAFFAAETRKDPKSTQVSLYLFSAKSGELVAEETTKITVDNTDVVVSSVDYMMRAIAKKIPYDALIVSRTDNRVTINAGTMDGLSPGQSLTCVKIISASKHPKRNFLIKSNKALVGQIRIVKADKFISFADIVSESEPGVLDEGVKVTGITKMHYKETPWTKTYTPPEQLLSENNKVVFGKNAREWIAKDPPTFGKVGGNFSLGSFNNNLNLSDGTNYNSKVTMYPKLDVHGEIWVTPKWYAEASFAQGIGDSSNPTGGSPSKLSNSLTQYRLAFGYNFILRNEFFGPKLSIDLGFNGYQMFVDSSSNQGFTSLDYTSVPIGIGGYVPINPSRSWAIGGKAYFHMFPRLRESPLSSGAGSSNNINQFFFYAENKLSQRLRFNIGLEFLLLSSTFSGTGDRTVPANNLSHRYTMLSTGIDYMF